MRKIITIIGVILIILAITTLVINQRDYLTTTEIPTTQQTNVFSGVSQPQLLLSESQTQKISGFQSSITAYIVINPSNANEQFTITIEVSFPTSIYPGCNDQNINQKCSVTQVSYTAPDANPHQVNVVSLERSTSIPLLTSGLTVPSSAVREYYIQITSASGDTSFSYSYEAIARSRLGLYIFTPLLVIGIALTVAGVVLRDSSKGKKLKTRSWQEPTLGGSPTRNFSRSMRSFSGKKNKSGGSPAPVRVSSSVNCKKCGGVMPRNSQYCPHCYAKQ